MNNFNLTLYAQKVLFGPNVIKDILNIVNEFNWKRLMICTTPNARKRGQLTVIEKKLKEKVVATYEKVESHVQSYQVDEAVKLAETNEVDAIIGFGGGSPVGIAKAISMALEKKVNKTDRSSYPTEQPFVPVIAIPTTYAGSEMTPVYGVTHTLDNNVKQKITVNDPKVTPKLTIYDPMLTLTLPSHVTAGTGMNAIAHCIEALYSITKNPFSTSTALLALQKISNSFIQCYRDGGNIEARSEMLEGAFLSGISLSNVAMGLHHGICHVIGGTIDVSHGDVNSVMLPYVIRYNLDETASLLAPAAKAMGLYEPGMSDVEATEAIAHQIEDWNKEMNLPNKLKDLGLDDKTIPEIAKMAYKSRTVHNNPKKIASVEEIEQLLFDALK